MAIIISADEIKEELKGYSPEKAEEYHRESTKEADIRFKDTLKKEKQKYVILLNGGSASGKTEFMSTQLENKNFIIFDTTLSTQEGARVKIKKIYKAKKKPVIYSVLPDDLKRAFVVFLGRQRKFSDNHFYRTHAGARKTLLWCAEKYLDLEINIIESSYNTSEHLQFEKIEFDSRKNLIDYLKSIQKSENDILNEVLI